jgi:hypothetical protein
MSAIPVMTARHIVCAALLTACIGCAQSSALPPTLSLDASPCVAAPDLAGATPVPFDSEKPVTVTVNAVASCLQPENGERRSYAVFLLPETQSPYLVSVTSLLRGATLLSPRLLILDSQGKLARERQRDTFMFRGTSLYAGIRAYPGDRYLLVESDPATVGQRVSQVSSSTQTTAVATGAGGVFFLGTGGDVSRTLIYAHNGTLVVTLRPVPPVN